MIPAIFIAFILLIGALIPTTLSLFPGQLVNQVLADTVLSIVIGLSIYTAWQIAYGQPVEFKTYTNNDENFTIQYPADWQVEETDPELCCSIVEFSAPESSRFLR